MDSQSVASVFGAVLLVAAAAAAVGLFVPLGRALMAAWAVPLVAAVGGAAMAGSLYYSEVADFVPCELCWFQRIAMYPIGIVGVVAAMRRDRSILPYTTVLALGGAAIAAYHVQLQLFPDQSTFCALDNPCSAQWVDAFGWMSIPVMALLSFGLIVAVGLTAMVSDRRCRSSEATSDRSQEGSFAGPTPPGDRRQELT